MTPDDDDSTTMPRSEERESDSPAYFSSIFSPGTMVRVDREERVRRPDSEGGYAYVTSGSSVENRICFVKYTVNGLVSPIVDHARLHINGLQSFDQLGTRNRRRPDFLSGGLPHLPGPSSIIDPSSCRKRKEPDTIYETIQHSRSWTPALKKPHPLLNTCCKCIPFFGCAPVNHAVQLKSHIGKVLAFVMTGFVLRWITTSRREERH